MKKFWDTPEDFVANKLNCNSWVATAVVGSAAIGGAVKAYTANMASDAQQGANARAGQTQIAATLEGWKQYQDYYGRATGFLQPYMDLGKNAGDVLTSKLPTLTTPIPISQEQLDLQKPIELTQEQLEKTPGYQFTRNQGLKAVQNSAAARGLGVSGAAQKGAAQFATGLADQTYQNQFATEMANRQGAFGRYQQVWQNQNTQQQTAFDRLMGVIGVGAGASAAGAGIAQKTGSDINKSFSDVGKGVATTQINAGNAEAAGINAIGGAVSDFANVAGYAGYKGLYGNGPTQVAQPAFTGSATGPNGNTLPYGGPR